MRPFLLLGLRGAAFAGSFSSEPTKIVYFLTKLYKMVSYFDTLFSYKNRTILEYLAFTYIRVSFSYKTL